MIRLNIERGFYIPKNTPCVRGQNSKNKHPYTYFNLSVQDKTNPDIPEYTERPKFQKSSRGVIIRTRLVHTYSYMYKIFGAFKLDYRAVDYIPRVVYIKIFYISLIYRVLYFFQFVHG